MFIWGAAEGENAWVRDYVRAAVHAEAIYSLYFLPAINVPRSTSGGHVKGQAGIIAG